MTLRRNDIIQVNVIIITGLLILLSFQSLGSSIYETLVSNSLGRMADLGIEFNKVKNLYDAHCKDQTNTSFAFLNSTDVKDLCKKWEIEKEETHQESTAAYNYFVSMGILKDNTATSNGLMIMWGPLYVKMLIGAIIMPFIVSILSELKNKSQECASKFGMIFFTVGMIALLFGILAIIIMMNLTAPWQSVDLRPQV